MKAVLYKGRIWDESAVKELIDRSDEAVARALQTVYANQTADEQEVLETKHHNGVGFTGRDANFLSDVAQKYQRWGRWASVRQCNAVRRSIKKYWRQLLAEIGTREGAVVINSERERKAILQGLRAPVLVDAVVADAELERAAIDESVAGSW